MDKKDYKQQNVTKTWLNNKIYTINTNIQEKKIQIDIGTRVQGIQMGITLEKGDIYRGKKRYKIWLLSSSGAGVVTKVDKEDGGGGG